MPASDLPLITEADAREIVDKIVAMLGERFGINVLTPVMAARPDTPVAEAKTTSTATEWGAAALRSACEMIVNAPCGEQDATRNRQCYGIGQLVAGGELPEGEALSALREAAARIPDYDPKNPWKAGELARKVERSFKQGKSKPRAAEDPEPIHWVFDEPEEVAHGDEMPAAGVVLNPGEAVIAARETADCAASRSTLST